MDESFEINYHTDDRYMGSSLFRTQKRVSDQVDISPAKREFFYSDFGNAEIVNHDMGVFVMAWTLSLPSDPPLVYTPYGDVQVKGTHRYDDGYIINRVYMDATMQYQKHRSASGEDRQALAKFLVALHDKYAHVQVVIVFDDTHYFTMVGVGSYL